MLRVRAMSLALCLSWTVAVSGANAGEREDRVQQDRASGAANSAAGDEGARHAYQVAAIGDSLTDPRSHGGKYLSYLRDRCPASRFDNYGRGGENVAQMRRRFARDILGLPADPRQPKPAYSHVIIFGGVNDILSEMCQARTPTRIKDDMEAMYDLATRAGIRVVAISVSPWAGYTRFYNPRRAAATREVNDWIFSQQREGKIDFALDASEVLTCGDSERLCSTFEMRWIHDGLHFNADAHTKLGRALHESVFADCS
ncbi:MAG: SGNH/GDSL hydrolase family protein [Deltaproteobacteria bacterium]|nr:SGNH/GDSL hydrolase family protein [Deltaproteobacteria bacterium]